MEINEELVSKIKHLKELDLKGDLDDQDYELLKKLKEDRERALEKENQKYLPRQIIVVRKDLNMDPGKLAAQVAHASLATITNRLTPVSDSKFELTLNNKYDNLLKIWIEKRFTKIVLSVKNENELLKIETKAKEKGLPVYLIEDAGFTAFNEKTKTCLSIGPCLPEDVKDITGKLRLF